MAQEKCLQQFKLPEPVLCIGGYLQIELLGRVQRQHTDNLFYIRVSHVKVMGGSLSPAFDIDILEPSGKFAFSDGCCKAFQKIQICLQRHQRKKRLKMLMLWGFCYMVIMVVLDPWYGMTTMMR